MASQTFYNLTLNNTSTSIGGSTTSITANNLTLTAGKFTEPGTLTVNGSLLISAGGNLADGNNASNLTVGGNFTNNGTLGLTSTSSQLIMTPKPQNPKTPKPHCNYYINKVRGNIIMEYYNFRFSLFQLSNSSINFCETDAATFFLAISKCFAIIGGASSLFSVSNTL